MNFNNPGGQRLLFLPQYRKYFAHPKVRPAFYLDCSCSCDPLVFYFPSLYFYAMQYAIPSKT